MTSSLEFQAESLVFKIQHYLITMMNVTMDEANTEEFYRAFALTLREEIMINWTATYHTMRQKKTRILYYLCMEYLPGRMTKNNIVNMHASELVQAVLKKCGRKLQDMIQMEFDPGLGNGGLGRLASCLLDSLATGQYPGFAYGLRYQYGIFDQEIWAGNQVERPDTWLLHDNPWEFRHDISSYNVSFSGKITPAANKKGEEIFDLEGAEEVRAIAYDFPIIGYKEKSDFNVCSLRLWSTKESPRNFLLQRYNAGMLDQAAENMCLTDVLYPNDNHDVGKRVRLKQEFLLAAASVQDIIDRHMKFYGDMSSFVDKVRIQVNDTHPVLAIVETMRILMYDYDFGWEKALETVKICFSFTNHTVLKESLEEWNENRMFHLLPRQYRIIERLNHEFCNAIRHRFPHDEEKVRRMSIIEGGQVRMAHLAIYGTHKINGVAELHSEILKHSLFKDFYDMYPEKFTNVTNGVTQRRWLMLCNPELSAFITHRIGAKWITDFNEISKLAAFAADPESQKEFLRIKRNCKKALIDFIKNKNPIRNEQGKVIGHSSVLDEHALFDVHIKRIHEYKRQLMNALHLIMLYHELKKDPAARKIKRFSLFGGKAAPGYFLAKHIIMLIHCLSRKFNNDPQTSHALKVVYIENYNVSKAEIIIPAADLSEQISIAGLEASGTGNMKMSMNGALTIGTEDGANIEMHRHVTTKWWPFSFGQTASQNDEQRREGSYNPWEIYKHNPNIKAALDALRDRSLAENDEEHLALTAIYHSLLEHHERHDRFFVLADLGSYYETQKKVEELYSKPHQWAEYALHNIAGMGYFSSDRSIEDYAKLVWDLHKCPVDKAELHRVQEEYSAHDRCRILVR